MMSPVSSPHAPRRMCLPSFQPASWIAAVLGRRDRAAEPEFDAQACGQ